jgi:exonuclease V gamma subunit
VNPGQTIGTLLGLAKSKAQEPIHAEVVTYTFPATAVNHVRQMVSWFLEGQRRPLHFFPASAGSYVEALDDDGSNKAEAIQATIDAQWSPDDIFNQVQDINDDYIGRAFPEPQIALDEEFATCATTIVGSAWENAELAKSVLKQKKKDLAEAMKAEEKAKTARKKEEERRLKQQIRDKEKADKALSGPPSKKRKAKGGEE